MNIVDALAIVLDLANQNIIDENEAQANDLWYEYGQQTEAVEIITKMLEKMRN